MCWAKRKKRTGTEKELYYIYKLLGQDLNRKAFWYNKSFANEIYRWPSFKFNGIPEKAEIYYSLGQVFFKALYTFTNDTNKTLCIYPKGDPIAIADAYCDSMKDNPRGSSNATKGNDPRKVMEAFMIPLPCKEKVLKIAPDIVDIRVFNQIDGNIKSMIDIAITKMDAAVEKSKERFKEKFRDYLNERKNKSSKLEQMD